MRFLDASEQAQRAAVAAEETKRQRQLRRAWRWAWGSGLVTLMLLVGILGYFAAFHWNHDAYFNKYVKVFGVPRGIGPLTAEQIRHRDLSYKITTEGRYGLVLRMEAVNATGQFTTGGMTTGFESSSDETAKSEVRWEYVYNADGLVAYEVSLDRNGQRVRSIIYSPADQKTPDSRNAYMISLAPEAGKAGSLAPEAGKAGSLALEAGKARVLTPETGKDRFLPPAAGKAGSLATEAVKSGVPEAGKAGSLATEAGSCTAFLNYEYSKYGYEVRTHYLDQIGKPTAGKDGVFILQKEFDPQGNEIRLLSLWKDGLPMNDKMGNAEARGSYDDLAHI
jgi:hypothetical protein